MEDPRTTAEREVVDQCPISSECLRADARRPERDLVGPKLRHVPLELLDERRLRPVAPHLGDTRRQIAAGEAEEASIGQRGDQVARVDIAASIALASERKHRIRPGDHRPVDALRQVDAEEGKAWIGDGVDQATDETARLRGERVLVAAERHDRWPPGVTAQRGDPIGLKTRARDHKAAGHVASSSSHDDF